MIDSYCISQAICVAADLGIADLLASGPKHCSELASATRTNTSALCRLLRALTSVGIFEQSGAGRFTLNSIAESLRADVQGSLRAHAIFSRGLYDSMGHLKHCVTSGQTAFEHMHGMSGWQYREQNPDEARVFNDAMTATAALTARSIVEAYNFSRSKIVMDIGGGQAALLMAILNTNPGVNGILLDLSVAIREARTMLDANKLAARCEIVEGSFFDPIRQRADVCILSRVLHDWNDEECQQILKNARGAMSSDSTLLIVERVLSDEHPAPDAALSDILMLVRNGGCAAP